MIVIAPECGSSSPMKPFAVLTRSTLPRKYLDLTRSVPKVNGCLEDRCPEVLPAGAGEHAPAFDRRIVTTSLTTVATTRSYIKIRGSAHRPCHHIVRPRGVDLGPEATEAPLLPVHSNPNEPLVLVLVPAHTMIFQ